MLTASLRRRFGVIALALCCLTALALRLLPHPPLRASVAISTAVYARDGQLLRLALAPDEQYRLWVGLDDIDPRLVQAVQLYEDRWFYWHPGVNPLALVRAAGATYSGGARRGASTISMQLARRLYRIQSQAPAGKLRQAACALWLEARYSKRELLEAYLNLAPYGGNIEGVGAASLIYFHKRAQHLTLAEVLTLAVIPQNPRKRASAARGRELAEARKRLWQLWLARHPEALASTLDVKAPPQLAIARDLPFLAPHLTDRLLREQQGGEVRGDVWSGLDLRAQATLERGIAQFVASHRGMGIVNASAMLLDRDSGEVRALVGSADYFDASIDGQVNGTEAKRSPGSTLKPFIYGMALDQGLLHPATMLKDAPTAFGPFSPENFDGNFVGPISAQEALVRSRNVPAVAVASKLANPRLYDFLKSAGVTRLAGEQHYGLALALGGGEVTMEELARMYLMLANRGVLIPVSHQRRASGTGAQGPRLLSEEAAFITLQMLRTNRRPDTGEPAAPPVAWKTGTSWGFRDAWTAGVFGRYVLLVWVGNFDGTGNPAFVGVQTAAPLFFGIVDSLRGQHLDVPEPEPAPPANVTRIEVCSASGDLPNDLCKEREQTWFIPGKSPIRISQLHRAVTVDAASGQPTCARGPGTRSEVYEFWPTDMQRLFREAGMPRRQPPVLPDCGVAGGVAGGAGGGVSGDVADDGPTIASPNKSTTYTVRLSKPAPLALRANSLAAQDTLFWFANGGLVGKGRPAEAVAWTPAAPGHFQLRVVDQAGRADTREVDIEFAP
jgi:penicillin-binding protein 1C